MPSQLRRRGLPDAPKQEDDPNRHNDLSGLLQPHWTHKRRAAATAQWMHRSFSISPHECRVAYSGMYAFLRDGSELT